jgi:Holliday junction resolvase RusA-like endonuclease
MQWQTTFTAEPVGKGSVRTRVIIPKDPRKKPFATTYPDPKSDAWEDQAADWFRVNWRPREPLDCPCVLLVEATFPRTKAKTWKRKRMTPFPHTVKPDGSNVLKAVEDALVKGGVMVDDSRIFDTRCVKRYAGEGAEVSVKVTIRFPSPDQIQSL